MSTLTALRGELVASLAGLDINTYTHIPGRLTLPGVFVEAGSPYIEQGDTFQSKTVRFGVVLCVNTGQNKDETEALDDLIETVQELIESYDSALTDGWTVEAVSQPFIQSFNNAEGLVSEITVTTVVTFT